MTPGLELCQLKKSYGSHLAVNEVSFTIPKGQFVCFLGPSGCGKTTLLRMIAGLERPSSGRIAMDGQDITHVPVHERHFAMVFQSLALFPFLTVEQNIAYSLRLRAVDADKRRARVQELLSMIKLPDIGSRSINQLSGGQRQRVAIARALAQDPRLFLLDEPLSALDAKLRDHMQVELRQLQRKLHITTILVTHDQHEAMTIADTIVVMADGAVQQIGSPTEIYRNPSNRFVANFIGRSNLLEAEVADGRHVSLLGRRIRIENMPKSACVGDTVTLAVRPEDINLFHIETNAPNCLAGRVTFARDVGDRVELRIDCQGREIVGSALPIDWARLGIAESVAVQLRAEACSVLMS